MSKSLNKRMDNRDKETFAHNIKDYTKREGIWAGALEIQWGVSYTDNGVDNTGELIEGPLAHHNTDFIFNKQEIEIKTIPEWCPFFTFKVFSLENCKKKGALIVVPKSTHYFTFLPHSIERMLIEIPKTIYRGFSPNDLALRVYEKVAKRYIDNGWIKKEDWGAEALKYINKHKSVLFKEKALTNRKFGV